MLASIPEMRNVAIGYKRKNPELENSHGLDAEEKARGSIDAHKVM